MTEQKRAQELGEPRAATSCDGLSGLAPKLFALKDSAQKAHDKALHFAFGALYSCKLRNKNTASASRNENLLPIRNCTSGLSYLEGHQRIVRAGTSCDHYELPAVGRSVCHRNRGVFVGNFPTPEFVAIGLVKGIQITVAAANEH